MSEATEHTTSQRQGWRAVIVVVAVLMRGA